MASVARRSVLPFSSLHAPPTSRRAPPPIRRGCSGRGSSAVLRVCLRTLGSSRSSELPKAPCPLEGREESVTAEAGGRTRRASPICEGGRALLGGPCRSSRRVTAGKRSREPCACSARCLRAAGEPSFRIEGSCAAEVRPFLGPRANDGRAACSQAGGLSAEAARQPAAARPRLALARHGSPCDGVPRHGSSQAGRTWGARRDRLRACCSMHEGVSEAQESSWRNAAGEERRWPSGACRFAASSTDERALNRHETGAALQRRP
jgi:hypothetical protein